MTGGVAEREGGFTRYLRGGGVLRRGGARPRGSTLFPSAMESAPSPESSDAGRRGMAPRTRKDMGLSDSLMMGPPPWRADASVSVRGSMYKSAPSKVPIHTHGCSRSNSKFLGAQWSGMSRQCSQKPGVGAREQSLCVQVGGIRPLLSKRDPNHHSRLLQSETRCLPREVRPNRPQRSPPTPKRCE